MYWPVTPHGKAILACAVGDTLGLPFEYSSRVFDSQNSPLRQLENITWSDDTQQSLILLDDYLRFQDLDDHRFMRRLVTFRDHPGGNSFGLHRGTGRGFRHSVNMYSETSRFCPMPGRDGNGAAMRVASVAFALPMDESVIIKINNVNRTTHDMPNSLHSAEAVVRTVWAVRQGKNGMNALESVVDHLPDGQVRQVLTNLASTSDWKSEIVKDNPAFGPGHGYSLRSPLSAIYIALTCSSIEDAISTALALGDDTDSTASIAAAIATGIHPIENLGRELLNFRGCQELLIWDNDKGPEGVDYLINLEKSLFEIA